MTKYVRDSKPGDTILLAYKVPLDASYDQNDGSYLCGVLADGGSREVRLPYDKEVYDIITPPWEPKIGNLVRIGAGLWTREIIGIDGDDVWTKVVANCLSGWIGKKQIFKKDELICVD